jgi:hypothetical protein
MVENWRQKILLSSNFSSGSFSLMCIFCPLSRCLLPNGRLNYPPLRFMVYNWYFCCFSSNYVVILMITLLWFLFVIYLCIIWKIEWLIARLDNSQYLNLRRKLTNLMFVCKILDLRLSTERRRSLPDPNRDLEKWFR